MKKQDAVLKAKGIIDIIAPAYNAFQAKDQQGQIDELLLIFAGSSQERQAELLGLIGTSFKAFYEALTQTERETLLTHFGIAVEAGEYADLQQALNAALAGRPSLYCFSFQTEVIFYLVNFAYTNELADLEEIDQALYFIFMESHIESGIGFNVWCNFIEYCMNLQVDYSPIIDSFIPRFREY